MSPVIASIGRGQEHSYCMVGLSMAGIHHVCGYDERQNWLTC